MYDYRYCSPKPPEAPPNFCCVAGGITDFCCVAGSRADTAGGLAAAGADLGGATVVGGACAAGGAAVVGGASSRLRLLS